ncbi:PIGF/3-ketodihydrosphingosine reductase fusion protein-like isoform X2 [Actinidia eriantha]|uniref:PIGF/3-ketodihydrosphingosine reductase fusion protein-like isoform X2 n=1 Tax=Actinidia eriantha TaxID=165200 RepID=UPI00258B96AE|nr:PIGF/3-ketodihydrosphingosine reductase fusion protein-like isoform X2 [Actinidia eriantha]
MEKTKTEGSDAVSSPSPWKTFTVHLICGLGLALALWLAHKVYSINLISDPTHTLLLIWAIEAPITILVYSLVRKNPKQCSYWKAVGRGTLGLPAGAVVNVFGAVALGAPVGIKYAKKRVHYFLKTVNWSLVVPAASVYGSSWTDWQRIFAHTKPSGSIDYTICLPAHGAVIGAWFGAWPMPLDWERPWQEWPISVSYGAIAGSLIAMVASFGFTLLQGEVRHVKGE